MKESINTKVRLIAFIMLVLYFLLLAYLTFFSSHFSRGLGLRGINIVPFSTVYQYLFGYMTTKSIIINLAGNIAAFIPLGFLLPFVTKAFQKILSVTLISFLITFLIEMLQYMSSSGISDIDDIILNILGGILGYGFYKALKR